VAVPACGRRAGRTRSGVFFQQVLGVCVRTWQWLQGLKADSKDATYAGAEAPAS